MTRLRVLFMTDLDPFSATTVGGAETSIRLLANSFAARDNDVLYVTKASSWLPFPSRPMLRDDRVRHVTLKTLRGRARSRRLSRLRKDLLVHHLEQLVARHDTHVAYAYYELENLQTLLEVRSRLGRPRIMLRMAGLRWYLECLRSPGLVHEYERIFNEIDAVNFIHEDLEGMTHDLLRELGMQVRFRQRFVGDIGSSARPGHGPVSRTARLARPIHECGLAAVVGASRSWFRAGGGGGVA